ncbi:MAG: glycosyltransferase [Myxococcota bacterium]
MTSSGSCKLLNAEEMHYWCQKYHPDVVFEMNRCRDEVPFLPKEIPHIGWLVDLRGQTFADFSGSEIIYLFMNTWPQHFRDRNSLCRFFSPGSCPSTYVPDSKDTVIEHEISFLGHMTNPWSEPELSRGISEEKGMKFGDLLPELEERLRPFLAETQSTEHPIDFAKAICRRKGFTLRSDDPVLRYDIASRTVRNLSRRNLIDAVLRCTDTLSLFGPENWKKWPEYVSHYRGFLSSPNAMNDVYRSSRFNLHEGAGMHFRALDCMCAGGLLLAAKNPHESEAGGLSEYFIPDEHYVPFSVDTLEETLNKYVQESKRYVEVRHRAAERVRETHTWRHRGIEILRDVRAL